MSRNVAFFEAVTPYWKDLLDRLSAKGFQCYYIYDNLHTHSPASLKEEMTSVPLRLNPGRKNSLRLFELRRILRKHEPEVVISVEYSLLTFQLILLRWFSRHRFRLVTRCDDSYDMLAHPISRAHRLARRVMLPFLDDVILCDKRTYDYYRDHFRKGIYFPIIRDGSSFRSLLARALPAARALERTSGLVGKTVLLFVGRLIPQRNLERAIDAVERLGLSDLVFVIAGEGALRKRLEERADSSSCRIVFTGLLSAEALAAWYNLADLFILPSLAETFGAATNEALLAGCFCLVSEKAGSASLIEDGNGMLIDPESVEDIAGHLSEAVRHVPPRDLSELRANGMRISFEDAFNALIPSLLSGKA